MTRRQRILAATGGIALVLVAGLAVTGHVDGHALPAQAAGDGVGQGLFVFHDQHSHGAMVPASA